MIVALFPDADSQHFNPPSLSEERRNVAGLRMEVMWLMVTCWSTEYLGTLSECWLRIPYGVRNTERGYLQSTPRRGDSLFRPQNDGNSASAPVVVGLSCSLTCLSAFIASIVDLKPI